VRGRRVALTLVVLGAIVGGCGGSIASNASNEAGISPGTGSGAAPSSSGGGASSSGGVASSRGGGASSSGGAASSGGSGASSSGGVASSSGSSASSSGGASSGGGLDGSPVIPCSPRTCADYPEGTCGLQTDGCGGLTAQCGPVDGGLCPAGEWCGGGGQNLCGNGFPAADSGSDGAGSSSGSGGCGGGCCPKTCADYPSGTCSFQSDGCGGLTAECGLTDAGALCPAGQFCGGGGAGLCGTGPPDGACFGGGCVPMTCANYPAGTCGRQTDGCCGLTDDCGADSGACPADAGDGG
jgi:hypothetical protein